MTSIVASTQVAAAMAGIAAKGVRASLLGLGTAVPDLSWSQVQAAGSLAAIWNLKGLALERWRRIVAGSEIDKRHGVLPPEEVVAMSTSQRMMAYERHAPPLASSASLQAIEAAGIERSQITDIVVVSCTGFWAPGLDVALISRLGLSPAARRTTIGFMGCFGALNGLRVAAGLCAADPDAVTLLVCAELCSLHIRTDASPQNQVASALFGDGAAAAVLAGPRASLQPSQRTVSHGASGPIGRIGASRSLLLEEGREWMSWRITDSGFAMTLTRDVPAALRRSVAAFVDDLGSPDGSTCIVHPGGPGVLGAVDDALNLRGRRGIECARRILRTFGNMSSATALFVLEDALRQGYAAPLTLLAFGPGMTIEGLVIEADASRTTLGCASGQ